MSSVALSRPRPTPPAVSASPASPVSERLRSHWSEEDAFETSGSLTHHYQKKTNKSGYSMRSLSASTYASRSDIPASPPPSSTGRVTPGVRNQRPILAPDPIITISAASTSNNNANDQEGIFDSNQESNNSFHSVNGDDLTDELEYVTVEHPEGTASNQVVPRDKASRVLGIKHRRSMEPIPAPNRTSVASARSVPASENSPRPASSSSPSGPTLPLASLYVVSGLPKSHHTWTLADPDSVLGLHHSEGAVSRWWRPEVLGSTVSPGAGGGKKKRKGKAEDTGMFSSQGHLSKQEVGKMLSKALKLSFTREVEIIASTLQPASTVHTFTFTLPAPSTPLAPSASTDLLRASVLTSTTDPHSSVTTFPHPYANDPFSRNIHPSTAVLGPTQTFLSPHGHTPGSAVASNIKTPLVGGASNMITYHGVCLTVWSHADGERTAAIRRALEASRARKESANSLVTNRAKSVGSLGSDPAHQARRRAKLSARSPWGGPGTDAETDAEGGETDGDVDGGISESDYEIASTVGHGPGESTLFLPGDTVFWLPYALTLVSRYPIYDLMRDYLTLSWARFSKDVQSHTLQIQKILSHPAPRPGELVRLDASSAQSTSSNGQPSEASLEVVARFPGSLDFGKELVDVNFTMWPLFKCLNIDNILTICEIALSPTGRVLFFSRHPAMLSIAVMTLKYLVELRGWNGVALTSVHSRDAKIYIDDPGPWIMGLATEARYSVRPPSEVCIVDLDINYLSCPSPPPGSVSMKQQRDKYRQKLLAAFEPHYHPDHCVPSEFKEAFPAGRFRPVCKIQAKRGGASTAVSDMIKPPEWWNSTRIIQAFDNVLSDKMKKPSLLKRISSFGTVRPPPRLTPAEQHIQLSIRKRATAFVDARDDLETKIGRLSRRLGFLMTESDLWRDKFISFEQYAEKLSVEASELRAKINKEQRETKRLSSMVTMTAAEKNKLQSQLRETEYAHKEALGELDMMRETMEQMEQERAEMIAEVEAQIERALASITVDMNDSDYDSRPSSRLSSRSAPSTLRRSDSLVRGTRPMRSFSTESTLTESHSTLSGSVKDAVKASPMKRASTVPEVDEPLESTESSNSEVDDKKKKRFSATAADVQQDGMRAMDEGISQKSDKIAQKVLEIQRKLESALAADAVRRSIESQRTASESEYSDASRSVHRRRRGSKPPSRTSKHSDRIRGMNIGSIGAGRNTPRSASHFIHTRDGSRSSAYSNPDSTRETIIADTKSIGMALAEDAFEEDDTIQVHEVPMTPKLPKDRHSPSSPVIRPSMTPSLMTGGSVATDDDETDFQSAYSMSPRASHYGSFDNHGTRSQEHDSDSETGTPSALKGKYLSNSSTLSSSRERTSSTSTAKAHSISSGNGRKRMSEDTIIS